MSFAGLLALGLAIGISTGLASGKKINTDLLIEKECSRLLSEASFLVKHIAESSKDLGNLISHYEKQKENWTAFLNEVQSAKGGRRVHVVHQTEIKTLNEELWHMSGAEEYLETFHDLLHQFLRTNPQFGAVLHNDYKNHFVASELDAAMFKSLVLEPVIAQLTKRMQTRQPELDWEGWIKRSLYHGEGASPAEAYFRVGIAKAKYTKFPADLSVAAWRQLTTARRERLVAMSEAAGIKWETTLALLHTFLGRGPKKAEVLLRWLRTKKAEPLFEELAKYYDDLQIADFHPLPEPDGILSESIEGILANGEGPPSSGSPSRADWTVERRALFAKVHNARFIAVTDVQGLGSIARRFQDQWISNGAHMEDLQTVYAQSTAALEQFFAQTYRELKMILGPNADIHVYRSGDDAIWFLPRMSGNTKAEVRKIFEDLRDTGREHESLSLKLHYSNLIKIRGDLPLVEGLADGLTRARISLFAGKKKTRFPKK